MIKNNKKKYLKNTLLVLLILVLVLAPFVIAFSAAFVLPPQFEEDFESALGKKYERLNSVEGEKIVVVGGSSVAFGLDSGMLEEITGKPVVNFGLYAALGTRLMLDLSLSGISEGDTVVLAPELDEQTLSMYFNSHHTLIALEASPEMLKSISKENAYFLLGGLWKFGLTKIDRFLNGTPIPEGVYNAKNINEYGDIDYPREENVMTRYYDPAKPIRLTESIIDEEFLEYLNNYIARCEKKGAEVVFSYPPMNSAALSEDSDPAALEKYLIKNLDCTVISYINDYIMSPGYFYDTNFHLGEAGAVVRTRQLAIDLGYSSAANIEIPSVPPLPVRDILFDGYDENEKYFTYEALENGGMRITGLTDEGRAQSSLTIPLGTQGIKVVELDTGAFSDSSVRSLTISKDTNLRLFSGDGFATSKVNDVYIHYDSGGSDAEAIYPIRDFGGVKIHVKSGALWPSTYLWTDTVDHSTVEFVYDLND